MSIYVDCPACHGAADHCPRCHGRGTVLGEDRPDYPEDLDEDLPDLEELDQ